MLPLRTLLPFETNLEHRHPAWVEDDVLLADSTETRLRRGGPGGQNRNKVETAVRLEHGPTGQIAEANESRSQSENRRVALRRLRLRLALAVRTPPLDYPHWHEVVSNNRIHATASARTAPQLIAHAMNVLAAVDFDAAAAAKLLGVSRSQLGKFLLGDRTVGTAVNEEMARRNRPKLR